MSSARLRTRSDLSHATRIVIKIGSSSLTRDDGLLNGEAIDSLVDVVANAHRAGVEVVLVSSGAIAAGIEPLGLNRRPSDLATSQAAAAVGQGLLIARYSQAFARHNINVAQALFTVDDIVRRKSYRNAHRTLTRLLQLGVVPIVNENDTVATHEIRFGDNDRVAAFVSHMVHADALFLLTDVDSLYDGPPSQPGARRLPEVRRADDLDGVLVTGHGSSVGTGGMVTKVKAATIAATSGITSIVTKAELIGPALDGDDVGTWFAPTGKRQSVRLLWLRYAARPRGQLILDDGAVRAVVQHRKSLLAAGVVEVRGVFSSQQPVDLVDGEGNVIGRGLVAFSSHDIPDMLGKPTGELVQSMGEGYGKQLVHRDDLAVF